MTTVSIIGAGNGGVTAAYHLAKNGHSVCIYDDPAFATQIEAIQETGHITALDEYHESKMLFGGRAKIALATTNIEQALSFSDNIMMICPSFAQEILFKAMLPYLTNSHKLIIMPGNYGGLALNRMKNESGKADLDITFIDAISIPWACRLVDPGVITIMGIKAMLPLSIFPKATDQVKDILSSLMPIPVEFLRDPLEAGLENINFGGHPLLTTLNMGILENFEGNFNYYRDACSPATARAAAKMDEERLRVGKAWGYDLRTELDAMNTLYESDYASVYEFNRASTTHVKIDSAPASSKARYITEDVPYLLVPCYSLATAKGIKVPIVESCIHIASAYNDENYFETGRTIEKMGISPDSPLT
ncbi:MAG: NAD/NADP octopine/nopaline dehydrogenase family protein [Actinomycetaceae bacterium]|nr:NAD/NADP octopine/nopaline dehydrogenase family protein [Actinomycetaceae bacterium]